MSGGYILLHRSVFDSERFAEEPFTEREAWIWMLAQASYQPHKIRYYSKMITVGRGEVPTSLRRLSEKWRWSVNRVVRFLTLLESEFMISKKTNTGFIVITICNYDKYQSMLINTDTPSNTPTDTPSNTGSNTRSDTNIKKGQRKDKEGSKNIPPIPPSQKSDFVLPKTIPQQDWDDYLAMRKQIRKPMTMRAMELAVAQLERMQADGHEPGAVLRQSIQNSWQGLFPLKPEFSEQTESNQQRVNRIFGVGA